MAQEQYNQNLIRNAKLVSMSDDQDDFEITNNGAIAIDGEQIVWSGEEKNIPNEYKKYNEYNAKGKLITPGLIDCHTHLVFGGNRSTEFNMRLNGKSYQEIAKAGGGIASTMKATREASFDDLLSSSLVRLDDMIGNGVTTVEIKSGYGLDIETECLMLRVAKRLESLRPIRIKTSFLGSHGIAPEYKNNPENYIKEVCLPALKKANEEGLVDAVDGFCETVALNVEQLKEVFDLAQKLNLPIKLHAEQLSHSGGVKLATSYDAISIDHLEYANEEDAKLMSKSGSVAVILPGAYYTLNETQKPPIELFRKYKVPMAIATDCNPGSSPLTSILLAMNMASTLFKITPLEALSGVTKHAADALSLKDLGQIKPGMIADLAIWNLEHPSEFSYRIGFNALYKRIFGGSI